MPTHWKAAYPNFVPDPNSNFSSEFTRLAQQRQWKQGSKRYRQAWQRCISQEFTMQFGSDERSLDGWRSLCAEVGLDEIPTSITQCKKVLKGTWVNLVDLVDSRNTGVPVKRHKSAAALRAYTKHTAKIFPKEAAKQNGFLKALLITIY